MLDLRDPSFRKHLLQIQRRAERQELEERLTKSFVPTKVQTEISVQSNQLLFGRRGVGKTHTLKVHLAQEVQENRFCCYVDIPLVAGDVPAGVPEYVARSYFRAILRALSNQVLEHAAILEVPEEAIAERAYETAVSLDREADRWLEEGSFSFPSIVDEIRKFTLACQYEYFTILLDEWAQVPIRAQPYLAELIKRCFFAHPQIVVKIGVVDYAYLLLENVNGNLIGIEKSADIATDIRMDRYFVWDEAQEEVASFFASLLYNHIAIEALGLQLDLEATSAQKAQYVKSNIFTQVKVFNELCRASEGNARDFLVLFSRAHANFLERIDSQHIGVADVAKAASAWYKEDKLGNVQSDKEVTRFLKFLVEKIISDKRSRTFMVESEHLSHPLLTKLFRARLLHSLPKEQSSPSQAGKRYSLVTIDYGTYIAFKGTKNEPLDNLFFSKETGHGVSDDKEVVDLDELVPYDDVRSIRNIVVTREVLDRHLIEDNTL